MSSLPRIVSVVGNPRPASRTHALATQLRDAIAAALRTERTAEVDLAPLAGRVLDPDDEAAVAATQSVLAADVLVVASPTYKATYSGLLKAFLDRISTGALDGARAVPVLLGGWPNHQLAVDVHLTPLLVELGASVPARGLFVLEAEVEAFSARATEWAQRHAAALAAA